MNYAMSKIYRFLKKNKGIKVTIDKEGDNIVGIYVNPKPKILVENSGDHFPTASIYFDDGKFKVGWGTVRVETDFSGESEFENHEEVIKALEESL